MGKMIDSFSTIELQFNPLILAYSKVSPTVARALLLPVRVDESIAIINRLLDIPRRRPSAKVTHIRSILTQLGHINRFRNDLVHFGTSGYGNNIVVSNSFYARSTRCHRIHNADIRVLENINADLSYIEIALLPYIGIKRPHPKDDDEVKYVKILTAIARRITRDYTPPAWHYKPRVQASRQNSRRGNNQGRATRRRPSRA